VPATSTKTHPAQLIMSLPAPGLHSTTAERLLNNIALRRPCQQQCVACQLRVCSALSQRAYRMVLLWPFLSMYHPA